MKKYRFSKELEDNTLEYGDMLVIANIIYFVQENHLVNLQGCYNDYVFDLLKIKNKRQFCEKHYGYKIKRDGSFPSSEPGDYEALTRVAIALMKASEEKGFLPPMVYSTSEELKGKTLRMEDKVIFKGVKYVVEGPYNLYMEALSDFSIRGTVSNAYIFDVLGISTPRSFCQKYYGYTPYGGAFPQTKSATEEDYQALTRLTIALMRLSEFETVKDVLYECTCIKEHLKTPSLIPMAENLEKILEGKDPNSELSVEETKMVRELFNAAEDQIHKK